MIEYVAVDRGIAYRAVKGAFIQVYMGQGTVDLVPHFRRIAEAPVVSRPRVTMSLIQPASVRDVPDEAYRQEAARLLRQHAAETEAIAWVVPLGGFTGATARAVLSGVNALSGVRTPQQVFASAEDGARWLCAMAPTLGHTADALVGHVEELRRALGR